MWACFFIWWKQERFKGKLNLKSFQGINSWYKFKIVWYDPHPKSKKKFYPNTQNNLTRKYHTLDNSFRSLQSEEKPKNYVRRYLLKVNCNLVGSVTYLQYDIKALVIYLLFFFMVVDLTITASMWIKNMTLP